MRIDRIAAEIRPREPWEAVDLGFTMAARWRWSLWMAWAATALPLTLVIGLSLWRQPGWALIAIWWLKPLFDRPLLFVASRKLFGGDVRFVTLLGSLPKLIFRGHLLADLTLLRLQFSRSVALPVRQLEGLHGKARTKRIRLLLRSRSGRNGPNLTLGCWLLEFCLMVAFLAAFDLFLPGQFIPWSDLFGDGVESGLTTRLWQAIFVAYVCAMSVLEPMFVTAGFGLYVNHRSDLEGWDVQFAFEQLGRRARELAEGATRVAGVLLVGAALLLGSAPSAQASGGAWSEVLASEGLASGVQDDLDPRAVAEEVSASDEFSTTEMQRVWNPDLEDPDWDREEPEPWLEGLFGALAPLVQVVFWVLLIALVLAVLYAILRGISQRRASRQEKVRPTTVFGLDVRPESLPDDVAGEALALWRAGDARGALSLLYRATIVYLIDDDGLLIEESHTERDCLRRSEPYLPPLRFDYFAAVTETWQRCAYGRIVPTHERAVSLIERWTETFRAAPAAVGAHGDNAGGAV